MATYYYLGPWAWATDRGRSFWRAPAGAAPVVDLRPLPAQGLRGTLGDRPFGLFAAAAPLPSEYALVGDGSIHEARPSTSARDAWESLLGYRAAGDTLAAMLFDHLTAGSDPAGDDRARPLVPTGGGVLELHTPHGPYRERFAWGAHRHTGRVRDVLRDDFARHWEADPGHARKVLGFWCRQHGVHWAEFVPPRLHPHVPGPLAPQTTVTDSFTRADSTTVGNDSAGNAWTEQVGDWQVVSNHLGIVTTGAVEWFLRNGTDLSSANHSASADITSATTSDFIGVTARHSASAVTAYLSALDAATDARSIWKCIAAALTQIATDTIVTGAETFNGKLTANGSSVTSLFKAVSLSTTDTAITGNLRTGLWCWPNPATPQWDNFSASDIATLTQAATQFRNDDGSETTATPAAAQSADVTAPLTTNLRFRGLVNATDDPATAAYTLRYQKNGAGGYTPVLTAQPSPTMPAATQLDSGGVTTNASSYATNSVTLTTGRTYVLAVLHSGTATLADPTAVQTTGGAITFTKLDTQGFNTTASPTQKLTLWTVTAGATVTATITISAASATGCCWSLMECDANAASTFGTPAKTGIAANTTVSVTPGALTNSASLQLAFGAVSLNSTADTASGTNWASVGTGNSYTTPATGLETAKNTSGTAQQVTFSGAGSATRAAIAVEVIAATPALVPILVSASANFADAAATTSQLTGGTGSFVAGAIYDSTNGSVSVDIGAGGNTECEWCLTAVSGTAVNGDTYQFRVYAGSTVLDTYTNTPTWTIGSAAATYVPYTNPMVPVMAM